MGKPIKEAAIDIAEEFMSEAEESLKEKYGVEFPSQNIDVVVKLAILYAIVFHTCLSRVEDEG